MLLYNLACFHETTSCIRTGNHELSNRWIFGKETGYTKMAHLPLQLFVHDLFSTYESFWHKILGIVSI